QQAFHQYADHWQPGKGIAEPLLAQAKRGIVSAALCGVAQSGGEMAFWQAAAQALDINLALALTRTAPEEKTKCLIGKIFIIEPIERIQGLDKGALKGCIGVKGRWLNIFLLL